MNKYHLQIKQLIENEARINPTMSKLPLNYAGHNEKFFPLSHPQVRSLVKGWNKEHKTLDNEVLIDVLNSLYSNATSATEKYFASFLIGENKSLRSSIRPTDVDYWLNYLNGWAQIDCLCQTNFTADELLSNWTEWESFLDKFNRSKNIRKRRASLVLLIKPMRQVYDKRFLKVAIKNIDNLKHEKEILITKAISWILREMSKNYRKEVQVYLTENKSTLPPVAVRETRRKLETGRK